MKKQIPILIFLLFAFTLLSCERDETPVPQNLVGRWRVCSVSLLHGDCPFWVSDEILFEDKGRFSVARKTGTWEKVGRNTLLLTFDGEKQTIFTTLIFHAVNHFSLIVDEDNDESEELLFPRWEIHAKRFGGR